MARNEIDAGEIASVRMWAEKVSHTLEGCDGSIAVMACLDIAVRIVRVMGNHDAVTATNHLIEALRQIKEAEIKNRG